MFGACPFTHPTNALVKDAARVLLPLASMEPAAQAWQDRIDRVLFFAIASQRVRTLVVSKGTSLDQLAGVVTVGARGPLRYRDNTTGEGGQRTVRDCSC